MSFDKEKIKSHFNHFSKNYNSLAKLQKEVAQKLCDFAQNEIAKSQNILDLGCGTGFIAQNILKEKAFSQKNIFELDIAFNMLKQNNFSAENSNIFQINADIENLPFAPNSFDLALSSLAFQWVDDLNSTLKNIKKICKKSGSYLIFSIFTQGTLQELRKSAQELNIDLAVNNFIALNSLKMMIEENFGTFEIATQDFIVQYDDVFDLIHSMKNIGASYSTKKSGDILLKKSDFSNLNNFYLKNFGNSGRIKSSWKVAYIRISI